MQTKVLIVAFFALAASFAATAQANISTDAHQAFPSAVEVKEAGNSVYADVENDLYFIDFESLSVNLNDIVVTDANGAIVLEEKVFDLPVNTIYELDLSKYQNGKYHIELRSYTATIRKEVTLK